MSDPELLTRAIEASGHSARNFAIAVLDVDERTVRRWLAGDRALPGPVKVICAAILAEPSVAGILAGAWADLSSRPS